MNIEVIAKDNKGVKRCYGMGIDGHQAMTNCISASKAYLSERPDIESLLLYWGDDVTPIKRYTGKEYIPWIVSNEHLPHYAGDEDAWQDANQSFNKTER